MNWGINQRLEDHWGGGEESREQEERGNEGAGGGGRGRGGWVFGGNLRSTTRGTERGEREREESGRICPRTAVGYEGGQRPPESPNCTSPTAKNRRPLPKPRSS